MFLPILSGLIVSIDAFFIGLSLGLQKKCRFLYLAIINAFLFGLCMLGFVAAGWLYEFIELDVDLIVGFSFIALGLWCIFQNFWGKSSSKSIILVGLVMSVEAMMLTMGITLIFLPYSNLLVPITVALAHFGYSVLSFFLARTKYVKQIPVVASHIVSGLALIVYGLMAIFVEITL